VQRRRQLRDTMFFSAAPDRRIDYILVYGKDSASDQTRIDFEDGLRASGIELEREDIAVSIQSSATPGFSSRVEPNWMYKSKHGT